MRVPIWFMILLFGGVLVCGLIALPLTLFVPWDRVFGDGGVVDWLLNIFAYGIMAFLFVIPFVALGLYLVFQPGRNPVEPEGKAKRHEPAKRVPYRVWKAVVGCALIYVMTLLMREIVTSDPPFPWSPPAKASVEVD